MSFLGIWPIKSKWFCEREEISELVSVELRRQDYFQHYWITSMEFSSANESLLEGTVSVSGWLNIKIRQNFNMRPRHSRFVILIGHYLHTYRFEPSEISPLPLPLRSYFVNDVVIWTKKNHGQLVTGILHSDHQTIRVLEIDFINEIELESWQANLIEITVGASASKIFATPFF